MQLLHFDSSLPASGIEARGSVQACYLLTIKSCPFTRLPYRLLLDCLIFARPFFIVKQMTAIKKKLVVLTGAGISAESGIPTFRGSNGLWEGHDVRTVASPEGWAKDRALVLEFYNQRRRQMVQCAPNAGHFALAELEKYFDVQIITQNIDNLHERAGSTKILHIHGEILKARSTLDPTLIYDLAGGKDIVIGDKCERGSQLRPDIVWFGEDVPLFRKAVEMSQEADIYLVVGTSLVVYPANTLVTYAPSEAPIYIIDPAKPEVLKSPNLRFIVAPGTIGLPGLMEELIGMA
jgi:NAD-dependent deacetylase